MNDAAAGPAPAPTAPGAAAPAAAQPGLPAGYVEVPVAALWAALGLLAALCALLIWFFLACDVERWLAGERLGVKIGELVLDDDQLAQVLGPGPDATRRARLHGLLDSLALAELARRRGLTQSADFRARLAAFDAGAGRPGVGPGVTDADGGNAGPAEAGGPDGSHGGGTGGQPALPRLLFLLDELAGLARAQARLTAPAPGADVIASAALALRDHAGLAERFHLRELLVADETAAAQALAAAAAGASFPALNASWPASPYAAVDGDLGWVRRDDLATATVARLDRTPTASLTVGYADEAGLHLLFLEERIALATATAWQLAASQLAEAAADRAERDLLTTARQTSALTPGPGAAALLAAAPWPPP